MSKESINEHVLDLVRRGVSREGSILHELNHTTNCVHHLTTADVKDSLLSLKSRGLIRTTNGIDGAGALEPTLNAWILKHVRLRKDGVSMKEIALSIENDERSPFYVEKPNNLQVNQPSKITIGEMRRALTQLKNIGLIKHVDGSPPNVDLFFPCLESTLKSNSCLEKAQEGEPTFTLRAQDKLAPAIVLAWCTEALKAGASPEKITQGHVALNSILQWQIENPDKVKTPD